jgi:Mg-chelatase subunit ChlD
MKVTGVNRNEQLTTITVQQPTDTKKPRILNIFLIDASQSMNSYGRYTNALLGVNTMLADIKKDEFTENYVQIIEFEDTNITTTLHLTKDFPASYTGKGIGGWTPLNQAVGETLEKIIVTRKNDFDVNDKILVSVLTDGEENYSSGKWSKHNGGGQLLGKLIKELESQGVTVTFMGAKNEVNYAINTLNLKSSNTLVHDNTGKGILDSYERTVTARQLYSKSVSRGEDVKESFYTKTLEKNDK